MSEGPGRAGRGVGGWLAGRRAALPSSGQCHVEAPRVIEEADALVLVGADTRQDDEVLLPALERVHAGNLHLLWVGCGR